MQLISKDTRIPAVKIHSASRPSLEVNELGVSHLRDPLQKSLKRHVKEAKIYNITQQITLHYIKLQQFPVLVKQTCHIDKAIAKESNRSI